jgi:hypothetical protein
LPTARNGAKGESSLAALANGKKWRKGRIIARGTVRKVDSESSESTFSY